MACRLGGSTVLCGHYYSEGCVHTEIRGIDIIRQLTSQRVLNLRHGKGQAGLFYGLYSLEITVSASAALFKALPIPIVDIRYLRA